MMKRGRQKREKSILSASGLLGKTRDVFDTVKKINNQKRARKSQISLSDSLMSALAMFSLKSESLFAFDRAKKEGAIKHNLKSLYGIKSPPSDTYMREELDLVDLGQLRKSFTSVFSAAQRSGLLKEYKFLDTYLVSADGTGMFNSEKIFCENCCQKKRRDGTVVYYHQALCASIVHPDRKQVIPFCPEIITKQDGCKKNDCEQNALKRFLSNFKSEHPQLKITLVLDALHSTAPQVKEIVQHKHHYIINVKPKSHKSLFEWIDGANLQETNFSFDKNTYKFRFINGIPLNATKDAPMVNFFECVATETKGRKVKQKTFTWVTSHKITKNNVYLLMKGGRSRWKIENETFNTLKNQGYQFQHNFGHGHKNLMSVFIYLMMLAFFIDQVQEASCGLFQAALEKTETRKTLWKRLQNYFFTFFVSSWSDLFKAVATSYSVPLSFDSS